MNDTLNLIKQMFAFMWVESHWWTVVGFLAAGLFSARFLVQWLASEKEGRMVMPIHFWYFSIVGGALNVFYTVHVGKMPLILGAVATLITSSRSLVLHRRGINKDAAAAASALAAQPPAPVQTAQPIAPATSATPSPQAPPPQQESPAHLTQIAPGALNPVRHS